MRDGFLAEPPATDEESLEYYTRIGMFVARRWQAIAADTPDEAMDEEKSAHRWDECTTQGIDNIREDAHALIGREVARQRVRAAWKAWRKQAPATKLMLRGITWLAWRVWEHFWGAIGLVAFGLVLVWLAPHFTRDARMRADTLLPADTSPYRPPESNSAQASGDNEAARRPAKPTGSRRHPSSNGALPYEGSQAPAAPSVTSNAAGPASNAQ
ncbi:MAG TPA: hypothetical protein VGW40_12510 [Allosphingosinicella sp.]|nr:hypothetical protein [Allosphingosinicella sp.]